jgi:hypothetical protein
MPRTSDLENWRKAKLELPGVVHSSMACLFGFEMKFANGSPLNNGDFGSATLVAPRHHSSKAVE